MIVETTSAIHEEERNTATVIETEEAVETLISAAAGTQSNVEEEGVVIHSFVPQHEDSIIVCESQPDLQAYETADAVQNIEGECTYYMAKAMFWSGELLISPVILLSASDIT